MALRVNTNNFDKICQFSAWILIASSLISLSASNLAKISICFPSLRESQVVRPAHTYARGAFCLAPTIRMHLEKKEQPHLRLVQACRAAAVEAGGEGPSLAAVKELLGRGVDPGRQQGCEGCALHPTPTPAHYAVYPFTPGAEPFPLHAAAEAGCLPLIQLLLEAGACPVAADEWDQRPDEVGRSRLLSLPFSEHERYQACITALESAAAAHGRLKGSPHEHAAMMMAPAVTADRAIAAAASSVGGYDTGINSSVGPLAPHHEPLAGSSSANSAGIFPRVADACAMFGSALLEPPSPTAPTCALAAWEAAQVISTPSAGSGARMGLCALPDDDDGMPHATGQCPLSA